ncbi:39S ribosomal protein L9, mitochondrial isoform X1 [Accipiter gentilis]|uniref:39S ribosomal protein L9, mitochondrial isoform X1 n=1 Tax=Astur gentilis TaxID=8957 RepID=UPI0021101349|nr:39S ribosomal protein L9, mitochondrial isoform X1 [Accipiter gentilis]
MLGRGAARGCGLLLRAASRALSLSHSRGTVVVERWWQVPLSKEGQQPRLHPRRHRIYRLVEDTKHLPKTNLELILTQSVENLGNRGDVVSVKKSLGRNKLLPQGLAVYASPENRKMFEEEKKLRQEGKLEALQTQSGEKTIKFLKSCRLEVGMKNNVKWELNNEIVARHFFKNLRVFVPPHALKLPEEPITRWGEYWCDVTVNGLETVRVPMSVVKFLRPKTKRYKHWLAQQQAQLAARREALL